MSKVVSLDEMVAAVPPGAVVSFGGGGMVRKPMAAVAALALRRTPVRVSVFLGGPDVDLMLGLGDVAELQFAYVGLDALGLSPHYRRAREKEGLPVVEWTEAMYIAGVEAGCRRVPFMPTRSGLGVDVMELPGTPFARFPCPLTGEMLTAVPAITPDVFVLHANEADRAGNVRITGDGFLDPQLARAATTVYVTAERVVDRLGGATEHETTISRLWVDGVAEVPEGSGFTASFPGRPLDYRVAGEYVERCTDPEWLREYAGALAAGVSR
ncbi:CoA transferase subunit A [Pseudonocardia sp. C8]|uniref:CoA transferase subunit A n=1 Tax=Pseudonocardia sp. C8 TaxID=2762759 RepID=UPI00164241AD|nr:CoA-transferase [Pseudonocardia sp. C8]MBC3192163.1 CoA transferase subunit A [Pseudonocardia sp. C8]